MVRQLERSVDELEEPVVAFEDLGAISGDDIAAELERYLREEHGEPD